ncbi:ANTAR domain-containing protein [Pseudarthrobacter psychrotolerans]|uniref:ANTAR domain-containing protein n=1 Tax=Pseudarthrobacter psychrotolerans TaxID=2697569 RepID=A0A6P1NHV4_9MICC|nr:GAF and ANTAR domain-containing protein [Pseudarthrobacter psychrotolerans]QHK20195.1 ANTAR domain-containing protein [Pseudarthrobacter psychrotolerans]
MMIDQLVDWRVSGVLLDIRGHSEAASACALARIATSAVSDIAGSPVEATVTLVRPDSTPFTAATTDGARDLSRWDQFAGRGPTSRALDGRLTIILNDHCLDTRWEEYPASLRTAGFRSAVGVPLQLERGYRAALTLYSAETNVFSSVVASQTLAFSGVAARSLVLALQVRAGLAQSADLRAAIASRTAINTACGVLMGQNKCSYEAAFQMLRLASSHGNLTIRDVAEGMLSTLPGGVPATHFQQRA